MINCRRYWWSSRVLLNDRGHGNQMIKQYCAHARNATLTFTSLKPSKSVENVELTTDGLFLTLGKMMPPLRDNGFVVLALTLVGMAFDWMVLAGNAFAPAAAGESVVDDEDNGDDEGDAGNVVVGSGGSVNSSIREYLKWANDLEKK